MAQRQIEALHPYLTIREMRITFIVVSTLSASRLTLLSDLCTYRDPSHVPVECTCQNAHTLLTVLREEPSPGLPIICHLTFFRDNLTTFYSFDSLLISTKIDGKRLLSISVIMSASRGCP